MWVGCDRRVKEIGCKMQKKKKNWLTDAVGCGWILQWNLSKNVQERLHATMEMRRKYMFEDKNESETRL